MHKVVAGYRLVPSVPYGTYPPYLRDVGSRYLPSCFAITTRYLATPFVWAAVLKNFKPSLPRRGQCQLMQKILRGSSFVSGRYHMVAALWDMTSGVLHLLFFWEKEHEEACIWADAHLVPAIVRLPRKRMP